MFTKILSVNPQFLNEFEKELEVLSKGSPKRINANPDNVEHGLEKLVLTLIEFIRKLIERQALRRVESETLNVEEIERLGLTLIKLENKMAELKQHFHLTDEDLIINLGPIGELE